MFQKMCIPQERNNIRASENEITLALTHVDSWHRTVYPIFLLSKSCDFIKTAYFKSVPKILTKVQRSLEQSYTKDPRTTLTNLLNKCGCLGHSLTSVYFTRSPSGFTCSSSCPGTVQFPKTTSSHRGEWKEQWISCTHSIACSKQIKADCSNDVKSPGLS